MIWFIIWFDVSIQMLIKPKLYIAGATSPQVIDKTVTIATGLHRRANRRHMAINHLAPLSQTNISPDSESRAGL